LGVSWLEFGKFQNETYIIFFFYFFLPSLFFVGIGSFWLRDLSSVSFEAYWFFIIFFYFSNFHFFCRLLSGLGLGFPGEFQNKKIQNFFLFIKRLTSIFFSCCRDFSSNLDTRFPGKFRNKIETLKKSFFNILFYILIRNELTFLFEFFLISFFIFFNLIFLFFLVDIGSFGFWNFGLVNFWCECETYIFFYLKFFFFFVGISSFGFGP
jgi:hypothetical protein